MQIDVVLPVLDEAEALPWVLNRMPSNYNPIVVDNGSTDRSPQVAEAAGAKVVHEPQKGFGAACFTGLRSATAPIVCFMDCDGSLDPGQLDLVSLPVERGQADLTLGRRRPHKGAWPLHARIGNALLVRRLSRTAGVRLTDLGPMRCARREHLLDLGLRDRRFGWPLEMVVAAHSQGWKIAEVDVEYLPRVGTSKVTGTVRGTLRAISDMARVLER